MFVDDARSPELRMPFPPTKKVFGIGLFLFLWLLALLGGGAWLYARGFAPGASGAPRPSWPSASRLQTEAGSFTLIVALHPECPCSSATLGELARLLAQTEGRLVAHVVMSTYDGIGRRPEDSDLWKQASAIPGVSLFVDSDGGELRRFDARTSGETRLYDPQGRLLFKGGITLARGHLGDNPGEDAVRKLVLDPLDPAGAVGSTAAAHPAPASTPVFGCAL